MISTNPASTPPIDESLFAASASVERIRTLLAMIHSDLTGSPYPEEDVGVEPPGGVAFAANSLRLRLDGIAEALPLLREVITSPSKVSQLGEAAYMGQQSAQNMTYTWEGRPVSPQEFHARKTQENAR